MDELEILITGALDDLNDIDVAYLSDSDIEELVDHAMSLLAKALLLA